MRWLLVALLLAGSACLRPPEATARKPSVGARKPKPKPKKQACLAALDELDVPYVRAEPQQGIALPVEILGPVGGVTYRTWSKKKKSLVLDCSLVYSLALAGRFMAEEGIAEVWYTSAYQRRNIRGTNKPSQHSFGLAIDLHVFDGPGGKMSVLDDYEEGLGDDVDCVGAPQSEGARVLRTLYCRMIRSEMFRNILTPDYNAAHRNHFHVEVRPWPERLDLARR